MVHFDVKRKEILEKFHDLKSGKMKIEEFALQLFHFQRTYNPVYSKYIDYLGKLSLVPETMDEIPFLPIEVYKKHQVKTGIWNPEMLFKSSGTTASQRSVHYLRDINFYEDQAVYCFENSYGAVCNYRFFGLLPSYIEQGDSSLVHMVNHFMQSHPEANGGFFMNDHHALISALNEDHHGKIAVLFGVSYALLDLAIHEKPDLKHTLVIETGGMKGRGKELAREELHALLCNGLNIEKVHSEYGMTELLSQSYSKGNGIFDPSPAMRVRISDLYDPDELLSAGHTGRMNVIDLANIDSCSFIGTQDLGILLENGQFRVLGRTDDSDIRGCNLLYV